MRGCVVVLKLSVIGINVVVVVVPSSSSVRQGWRCSPLPAVVTVAVVIVRYRITGGVELCSLAQVCVVVLDCTIRSFDTRLSDIVVGWLVQSCRVLQVVRRSQARRSRGVVVQMPSE